MQYREQNHDAKVSLHENILQELFCNNNFTYLFLFPSIPSIIRYEKKKSEIKKKILSCYRVVKVSGTVHWVVINTEYKYFTCTWAQTRSTIQRQSTKKGRGKSSDSKLRDASIFLRFSEFS